MIRCWIGFHPWQKEPGPLPHPRRRCPSCDRTQVWALGIGWFDESPDLRALADQAIALEQERRELMASMRELR